MVEVFPSTPPVSDRTSIGGKNQPKMDSEFKMNNVLIVPQARGNTILNISFVVVIPSNFALSKISSGIRAIAPFNNTTLYPSPDHTENKNAIDIAYGPVTSKTSGALPPDSQLLSINTGP